MSDVLEFPSLPAQSATGPTHTTVQRRMRVGRALGPVIKPYADIWEAYAACRRLGREYSVTGHLDGWCIRRWIDVEIS